MISDEVKTLSTDIDSLVKELNSKKIISIKSREDLESLNAIIIQWKKISRSIKLEESVKTALDGKINECVDEASATNPMNKTVIKTLNEFNTILKKEVIFNLSVCNQTLLHPEIKDAMRRFEGSLKGILETHYFEEAEKCLENALYRSFIVSSWSVVMYRLYKLIEDRGFNQFISAFVARYQKTDIILNALSDFYIIPDSKTIAVAASKSIRPYIIDKTQKEILERNLKIRNMCAHVSENYYPLESSVLVYVDEVVGTFLSKT